VEKVAGRGGDEEEVIERERKRKRERKRRKKKRRKKRRRDEEESDLSMANGEASGLVDERRSIEVLQTICHHHLHRQRPSDEKREE